MSKARRAIEILLYGLGDTRRFTQDIPVLFDVWVQYSLQPRETQSLLLEPWLDTPAFEVAQSLRALAKASDVPEPRAIYNRTIIETTVLLRDMIQCVLPLTVWYRNAAAGEAKDGTIFELELPEEHQIWDDTLPRSRATYPWLPLLPMIRTVGYLGLADATERLRVDELLEGLQSHRGSTGETSDGIPIRNSNGTVSRVPLSIANRQLAALLLRGWKALDLIRPPLPAGTPSIYAIGRNRQAFIAQTRSIKTIKADAAHTVFKIDCSGLTWAIVDSGIDARHPAFVDQDRLSTLRNARSERDRTPETLRLDTLKASRIKETYDFSGLRELLLGDEHLPDHYRVDIADFDEVKEKIASRIRSQLPIDWEVLRPVLRIKHDETYLPPEDGHGTHVAGILAGDWKRSGNEHLRGVCPDIRLIDIRVCDERGRSNEFVIISALQFIRYLNANSEVMAVHGINMSLSLLHDAANYACGRTPVCVEAERAVNSGMVVVAAAGNQGYRRVLDEGNTPREQFIPVSITDPGNAEAVITVGATHRMEPYTYGISYFSSRGPTGDGRIKPDLVAPGEKIYAPTLNDEATRLDGTSMAAPHVSGAAAMLMARHSELIGRPERIKQILCSSASDLGRERYFQGYGLVDVLRAMQSL